MSSGMNVNNEKDPQEQKLCLKEIIPFSGEFELVKKFEGLNKPYDLKVDDDFVYVADRNNKQILSRSENDDFLSRDFRIILQKIEHFIGYIDSLQRYIYVKKTLMINTFHNN
ncbi:hypothetical protein ABK040_005016 [Willaertia magna]